MAADEGSVQKAASGVKTAGDISDVAAVREQDVKEREAGLTPASSVEKAARIQQIVAAAQAINEEVNEDIKNPEGEYGFTWQREINQLFNTLNKQAKRQDATLEEIQRLFDLLEQKKKEIDAVVLAGGKGQKDSSVQQEDEDFDVMLEDALAEFSK